MADPNGLARHKNVRPCRDGSGNEHLGGVVLGVVGASKLTEPAADAVGAVVGYRSPCPTQRVATGFEKQVVAIHAAARDGSDGKQELNLIVQGIPRPCGQVLQSPLPCPSLEGGFRDPLAEV
jgi:hypothetical protein